MTTTDTAERWERLGRAKCQTCFGDKVIPCPEHAADVGDIDAVETCPACQGTGLAMPELTEPCSWCVSHPNNRCIPSAGCHGTGRILLQGDLLQCAGERELDKRGTWIYVSDSRNPKPELRNAYQLAFLQEMGVMNAADRFFSGPDRLTGLLCALEALTHA